MERRDSLADIEAMADASEFISMGDNISREIRVNMNWSLLPNMGTCSSVAPCMLLKGKSFYPRFPEWLGKNSSQRKAMRLSKELKFAMGFKAQTNRRSIQLEVVPLILQELYTLLA